ncbi:MAG: hypothetical protein IJ466_05950 [Clostridia bacterium]|nr:hypothetical protein [Clostridia bacterium]
MKYRLTGISLPFGGLSWDQNTTAKECFQYLMIYLESKRILVNPHEMELKSECIQSTLEIKRTLTEIVKDAALGQEDLEIVRSMIGACNNFLDSTREDDVPHLIYKLDGKHWENSRFDTAMKEFRSAFRYQLKKIEERHSLHFGLEIPEEF